MLNLHANNVCVDGMKYVGQVSTGECFCHNISFLNGA